MFTNKLIGWPTENRSVMLGSIFFCFQEDMLYLILKLSVTFYVNSSYGFYYRKKDIPQHERGFERIMVSEDLLRPHV